LIELRQSTADEMQPTLFQSKNSSWDEERTGTDN